MEMAVTATVGVAVERGAREAKDLGLMRIIRAVTVMDWGVETKSHDGRLSSAD